MVESDEVAEADRRIELGTIIDSPATGAVTETAGGTLAALKFAQKKSAPRRNVAAGRNKPQWDPDPALGSRSVTPKASLKLRDFTRK